MFAQGASSVLLRHPGSCAARSRVTAGEVSVGVGPCLPWVGRPPRQNLFRSAHCFWRELPEGKARKNAKN